MPIRVKFFSSFCSSELCLQKFTSLMNNLLYISGEITYTNDDDYTHAILLNTAMPKLSISKENVLGLAFEPPVFLGITDKFIKYAQKHIGRYYIGHIGNLPLPFQSHHGFMWCICNTGNLPPLAGPLAGPLTGPSAETFISIIFSNKKITHGHKYRHRLVSAIMKHNLPIDIWGHGCNNLKLRSHMGSSTGKPKYRIRGSFQSIEPFKGYLFTIVIENCSLPDYFSEKLLDPLLLNVTPIYYGCQKVEEYFPNMTIKLTDSISGDIKLLKRIISEPDSYLKNIHIDRLRILTTMNLKQHLSEIFQI